jgi:hypothetical protein
MHAETIRLIEGAHAAEAFDPAAAKAATDALLDFVEGADALAQRLTRYADEVELQAATGGEDPAIAGCVLRIKSAARAVQRHAREARVPVMALRQDMVNVQRIGREIRATLKAAGEDVPDDDLSPDDLARAPKLRT